MNCAACGTELGLWAKVTGQSATGVCKKCQEQGKHQLTVLVQSVSAAQSFQIQYADRWAAQFEETAQKFHLPETETKPQRFALLNNMLKLVEVQDVMQESDLKYLLDLSYKYGVKQSNNQELADTLVRVGMREIIQEWERGEAPKKNCQGLVLQKNEVCHWEEAAALRIQKTQREYVGSYSSVSIPIVRGVRYRVGGFKGHPIDHTYLENGGMGVLHVTNQRVCFTGQHAVAIPYKKMISVGGFEGGFMIQTSNEKKPGIFIVRCPELTAHMVTLASHPADEDEPPKKRRSKAITGAS